jgi:hypothetical protein
VFLVFLFIRLTESTCGLTDINSSTITLTSLIFSYCTTRAVEIDYSYCVATVTDCQFSHISSSSSEAGLYFVGLQLFLLKSTFEDISGSDGGVAFYSQSSFLISRHQWNFTDVSAQSCNGWGNTMLMSSDYTSTGPSLNIAGINSTSNTITNWGSAFDIRQPYTLNFQNCFIKNASRYNCIFLSNVYSTHSIRCLVFKENICYTLRALINGMFAVVGSWTIEDSIFSNNVVDYLVGNWASNTGQLTFARCYFDSSSFAGATAGIGRYTTDCSVGGYPSTLLLTCITRSYVVSTPVVSISARETPVVSISVTQTPVVSNSVTQTPVVSESARETPVASVTITESPAKIESNSSSVAAVIGGVVGGLVFLIVVIVIGCFCYRKNRQKNRNESEEGKNSVQDISILDDLGGQKSRKFD